MNVTSTVDTSGPVVSRQAILAARPGRELQFQLRRIQTYNWAPSTSYGKFTSPRRGTWCWDPLGQASPRFLTVTPRS